MSEIATADAADSRTRAIAGVPLTRRNARNLALMAAATIWPPNTRVLIRNLASLRRREPWAGYLGRPQAPTLDDLIRRSLRWLGRSQDRVGSGGVGDFRFGGWTRGYPEVTGYIIPTLWDLSAALGDGNLAERAIRMADWELRIQKHGGGFESLYEGEKQPPVAFNTGQVIRGLTRTYQETSDDRYLDAAIRAGDWMVRHQEADGSWTKSNYLRMKRTYDVYAAAGLTQLADATGVEAYRRAALANAEFVVSNQLANGWFELCANTPYGNERPITHTLCYAADGLAEVGERLGEEEIAAASERTTLALMECVRAHGWLPGRFDREWRPRARYVILTGSAQLGVLAMRRHLRNDDPYALRVSRELLDFIAFVQDLNAVGRNRRGGLPGSYPIWGRYVPLKYPSWATKFFLDHLLLSRQVPDRED